MSAKFDLILIHRNLVALSRLEGAHVGLTDPHFLNDNFSFLIFYDFSYMFLILLLLIFIIICNIL